MHSVPSRRYPQQPQLWARHCSPITPSAPSNLTTRHNTGNVGNHSGNTARILISVRALAPIARAPEKIAIHANLLTSATAPAIPSAKIGNVSGNISGNISSDSTHILTLTTGPATITRPRKNQRSRHPFRYPSHYGHCTGNISGRKSATSAATIPATSLARSRNPNRPKRSPHDPSVGRRA